MKPWDQFVGDVMDRVSKAIGLHASIGLVYIIAGFITWILGAALF